MIRETLTVKLKHRYIKPTARFLHLILLKNNLILGDIHLFKQRNRKKLKKKKIEIERKIKIEMEKIEKKYRKKSASYNKT